MIDVSYRNRPDLRGLVRASLLRKCEASYGFPFPDDDEWDEERLSYLRDGFSVFGGRREYEKVYDSDGVEVDIDDLELDGDGKTIYFYHDIEDCGSCGVFRSLKSFMEFCEENGFTVPKGAMEDLEYNTESHTCLNPYMRSRGELYVMCCYTYHDLLYNASCLEEDLTYGRD